MITLECDHPGCGHTAKGNALPPGWCMDLPDLDVKDKAVQLAYGLDGRTTACAVKVYWPRARARGCGGQ